MEMRTVENDPFNHSTGTDQNYSEPEIARENDQDMHKVVQALKIIHGFPIEHVEQLLLGIVKEGLTQIKKDKDTYELIHQRAITAERARDDALMKVEYLDNQLKREQMNSEQLQEQLENHLTQTKIRMSQLEQESEHRLRLIGELDNKKKQLQAAQQKKEAAQRKCEKELTISEQEHNMKIRDYEVKLQTVEDTSRSTMVEIRKLLTAQQRMTTRWKEECTTVAQKYEVKITDLRGEVNQLKKRNQELTSLVKESQENSLEAEKMVADYSRAIRRIEERMRDSENRVAEFAKKHNTAKATTGLYGQERDTKWAESRNWQEKYKILKQNHEDLQQKFNKIDSEMQAVKDQNEIMDRESKSYQAKLQEKDQLHEHEHERERHWQVEYEKLEMRLSRHMGQQMSERNPNDTYLSDPNRPSKLGERYSELYDNEWTNAFEVLTDKFGKDEREAVDVLRNILWKSYASAFDISRTQIEKAEHELSGSSKAVSPECKRLLKEAQKHINIRQADDLIENALQRTIMKDIEMIYLNEPLVYLFAKECFQLCWLMSIQDPPVVLVKDPTKDDRFDTNIYRHYVNSGDTVDYVVWPALLLFKDGPVLTKGVAQPTPKSRPKSAFSFEENKKTNERTSDKLSRSLSVGKPSTADRRNRNQDD